MHTTNTHHGARLIALGMALALAPAMRAQGFSYDITTSVTGLESRGGGATSRTMMAGHGQIASGLSRLDFTQSMAPGGLMGAGTYMITNAAKRTTTSVNPAKHEYMVMDMAQLAKASAGMQQAMGGMMKMEIADIKVAMEDLGPGESMEGYSTLKYRMTDSYTMKMTIMGRTTQTVEHGTSEIWVAPQLDPIMNPGARPVAGAASGPMAELTTAMVKAYANVRKGVVLKSIHVSESVSNGKTSSTTMTMTLSNVKHASISPSIFEVPAGYTKTESLSDALSPMGAIGDSMNAARARKAKNPDASDSAPQASEEDKALAKKALGKLFGRPPQ